MNPNLKKILGDEYNENKILKFDSNFECGNLDMVTQIRELEYELYMRVDTNTRGNH